MPGWGYPGKKHSIPDYIGLVPRFSLVSPYITTNYIKFGSAFISRTFLTLRCQGGLMFFTPFFFFSFHNHSFSLNIDSLPGVINAEALGREKYI